MPLRMRAGHGQLRLGHVDADDSAVLTGQLRESVDITACAAAEVENAGAGEKVWGDQAAAIISSGDFWVNVRKRGGEGFRGRFDCGASIGP